ncbi:MAG: hypothetical protein ACRD3A_10695 [Terriglobales bacterium]
MRKSVAGVGLLFAILGGALAQENNKQDESKKNELGLLLGGVVTGQKTTMGGARVDVGTGLTFQATYARRLAEWKRAALYFEVPFVATPSTEVRSTDATLAHNYDTLYVTPGLRVKLAPRKAVSPWFAVGGGYGLLEASKGLINGTPNPSERFVSTGTLQFGGGVDFDSKLKILVPIGFRAEVRDFYTAAPRLNTTLNESRQHNVLFSGGLVLKF